MDHGKPMATPSEAESEDLRKSLSEPLQPLVLRVALRPLRVFALTVLSIGSLSALIVFLHQGQEVLRFNRDSKSVDERLKLVDRYNSYAANFATMLGKPIELFVTAAVQVFMLRFLSARMLRAEQDRRMDLLALALSTGVGYMISNGFGALNVQQRDLDVRPVIVASDLSAGFNSSTQEFAGAATSVNQSFSELDASNPTINTVLRTLVVPRQPKPVPKCDLANTQADLKSAIQDDILQFGMQQREWMDLMLPEALNSTRLRIVINATDKDANKNVRAADFPMDAARASNLFVHAAFLSSQYLPWGRKETWTNTAPASLGVEDRNVSTAMLMGVVPTDASASETAQREWFLRESGPLLGRLVAGGTANMSTSDIGMELSRTQLSPSITFDAITFEVDVDPALYTTIQSANNQSRLLQLDPYQCKPWHGRCLVAKKVQPPLTGAATGLFDAPMVVHAFAMCLDNNGAEALQSTAASGRELQDFGVQDCTRTSTSSLLLVSVAKRLVADSLSENVTLNEPGLPTTPGPVATNVRKIYTFTVGRLGWTMQNLSEAFSADCDKSVEGKCMGLSLPLAGEFQTAVVGTAGLPLGLVSPMYPRFGVNQRPMRLVQITEPPREDEGFQYNTIAGDLLHPHNVKSLTWDMNRSVDPKECSTHQEDRVRYVISNHIYMETTLQSTYTAGMFFLFQDAVAQDVLESDAHVVGLPKGTQTLQFMGNVYNSALWLSTPLQNMLLTLAGCAVLAAGLFSGLVWSIYGRIKKLPDPLANITTPHVIARAMLDESKFPSLLLHRRMVDTSEGYTQKTVAGFEIQSLLLQSQQAADGAAA